jgi:hypothetical protein
MQSSNVNVLKYLGTASGGGMRWAAGGPSSARFWGDSRRVVDRSCRTHGLMGFQVAPPETHGSCVDPAAGDDDIGVGNEGRSIKW